MTDGSLSHETAKQARAPAKVARMLTVVLALTGGLALAGWGVRRIWNNSRDDPQELWGQAHAAFSAGQLDRADSILKRLAERRPATLADRLLRAQVARERGRLDLALAALEGSSDSEPGAALIWRTRGMLEFERERARPAEAALVRALALDPKLVEARRELIKLYGLLSSRRDLAAQYAVLSSLTTLTFDDLYLWCLGRWLKVGPAELTAKLERMLQNDPGDPTIRLALAENLRRLGRLDAAEEALAPLAAVEPDVRAARAKLALDRGAVDAAAAMLAESPASHAESARLLGRLALARGDAASAASHYRRALAADPEDRDTLFGLAQALRLAGNADAGKQFLQAARQRDRLESLVENARSLARRDDPRTLREIGDACRSVRRFPEARAWYRLALALDPLDAELQKRLFELDAATTQKAK
jgi:tetratricopeptide (TPR) repeat protein